MEGLNRIRALAAEVKNKPLLKVVKYLLTREDMNEKYLNEEKTLKGMVSYIRSEARKLAEDGVAMIEDSTVYNWAIHYFDESNEDLKISTVPVKEEKVEVKKESTKEVAKAPKEKSKSKEWIPEGQLSLFDY